MSSSRRMPTARISKYKITIEIATYLPSHPSTIYIDSNGRCFTPECARHIQVIHECNISPGGIAKALVHLNDIVVCSVMGKKHIAHVKQVLVPLNKSEVVLKLKNSVSPTQDRFLWTVNSAAKAKFCFTHHRCNNKN